MKTILRGTEERTLEIDGVLEGAPRGVPRRFDADGTVSLLLFSMRGLALRGVPWVGVSYREALWRVGVRVDGALAWLAVRCDLDSALVRAFGRRVVKYPARAASFRTSADGWSVGAPEGVFEVDVEDTGEGPIAAAPRRTFVTKGRAIYEIPWEEIPAPSRRSVSTRVLSDGLSDPTFGARVRWASAGLAHQGRVHMCGVARAV